MFSKNCIIYISDWLDNVQSFFSLCNKSLWRNKYIFTNYYCAFLKASVQLKGYSLLCWWTYICLGFTHGNAMRCFTFISTVLVHRVKPYSLESSLTSLYRPERHCQWNLLILLAKKSKILINLVAFSFIFAFLLTSMYAFENYYSGFVLLQVLLSPSMTFTIHLKNLCTSDFDLIVL